MTESSTQARLYATAEEARWAVDAAAYADGRQPDKHTWLGAISDEAECYCGIEMPLDDDGQPSLTFEEWLTYHDEVLMRTLDADELSDVDRVMGEEVSDETRRLG